MIRELTAPSFSVWPDAPTPAAPKGPPTGLVSDCDTYVRSPISMGKLESELEKIGRANLGAAASPVRLGVDDGQVDLVAEVRAQPLPENQKVLPLRLGALRQSIEEIERGDAWLADRNPVFYIDGRGRAHIDFTNLAGFIVDPLGHIVSRSVNPD